MSVHVKSRLFAAGDSFYPKDVVNFCLEMERRWSLLRWPTSSSCRGIWPSDEVVLSPLGQINFLLICGSAFFVISRNPDTFGGNVNNYTG